MTRVERGNVTVEQYTKIMKSTKEFKEFRSQLFQTVNRQIIKAFFLFLYRAKTS